ncbi:phosphohistidine phosphatase SixA [Oceanospirillaceae bacterium ASx5O]|nr:phosphohistidine phosphatase SixA [Oceanospirillaceae bacterium ASx5O]
MKVCIVRHGSAVSGAVQDQTRELTEKGQRQAQAAGQWLAEQNLNNPLLLCSPYRRTRQTAAAIAAARGIAESITPALVPEADVRHLLDELAQQQRDLILVSHLPLVGHLAALLVDGRIYDQPWSPAECWLLHGDIAAAGCMSVEAVWYPVLAGI